MSEPATKFLVQVLERRSDGSLWPVATMGRESGGEMTFTGDPSRALGPLIESTQKTTSMLMRGRLRHALRAQELLAEGGTES